MYLHSTIPRKGYQTARNTSLSLPCTLHTKLPPLPLHFTISFIIPLFHCKIAMHNPPRPSLDNTILTSPLYRRSSHRANTSVDQDIYTAPNANMSSSSREKATPPASPVLRGRSPWRAGDMPAKTKRSRTLGRVAVLLMLLGVLGYVGMGWGVCGYVFFSSMLRREKGCEANVMSVVRNVPKQPNG
jgi:hypothetical protein